MIPLSTTLYILLTHWFADFVLQSNWMAQNKSKQWDALLAHIGMYTLPFLCISAIIFHDWQVAIYWALFNGLAHGAVDYVTSRITSNLYAKGRIHDFFICIGFDQLIHIATLLVSYYYFTGVLL